MGKPPKNIFHCQFRPFFMNHCWVWSKIQACPLAGRLDCQAEFTISNWPNGNTAGSNQAGWRERRQAGLNNYIRWHKKRGGLYFFSVKSTVWNRGLDEWGRQTWTDWNWVHIPKVIIRLDWILLLACSVYSMGGTLLFLSELSSLLPFLHISVCIVGKPPSALFNCGTFFSVFTTHHCLMLWLTDSITGRCSTRP